ncbi:MAG: apolipoprotein N-acyltransferase [Paracoccaceae bacterium]
MQTAARWPGLRAVGLAFGLGLAVALGQVPFGLWPVAVAALVGLLALLVRAGGARQAFVLGLFAGAGHFALALNWIVLPFFVDPWRYGWMAPFALVGIAFGMGLFWAVAAAVAARARWRLMALVCALAGAEMLRAHILTGFPWALIGHIWLGTVVEQSAAVWGAQGMTLATLAAAALLLAPRWPVKALVLPLALAVLWGSYARLDLVPGPAPGGVVRVVQPNIPQTLKWDPEEARISFRTLLDLTAQPATPVPTLAIWPETAVPFLLTAGEGAAEAIGASQMPVAAGIQRVQGDAAWNSLALIGPGGTITQTYDKLHLVPFGEYIPFGDIAFELFSMRAFAAQAGYGYSAGTQVHLMDLGPALGLARPLICYEAIFPEEIASATRPGWLLQVTNDAWFGTLTGPYQHFSLARLRAIEQGLPLVRAANTGISAVVDAKGQLVTDTSGAPAMLAMGVQGVIDVALPGALPPPPYARWGDWPLALLMLAGLGLALMWPWRRQTA